MEAKKEVQELATPTIEEQIKHNQEVAAEVFKASAVIPYEKKAPSAFSPAQIKFYLDQNVQLPYCSATVHQGMYRSWIEQVPSATLRDWRDNIDTYIRELFHRKYMAPDWSEISKHRTRKLLYEIELVRRANLWGAEKKQQMLESYEKEIHELQEEYAAYIRTFSYDDGRVPEEEPGDEELPY